MPNLPDLDWQPVLLVKVLKQAFQPHALGLSVSRMHLAEHPDGILASGWDVPVAERQYPRAQLVGWKPARDVPFELPVKFQRHGSSTIATLIPRGTWVLPYEETRYTRYLHFQQGMQALLQRINADPSDPDLLTKLTRFVQSFEEN